MIKIAAAVLALAAAPLSAQSGAWQVGDSQVHLYYNDLDVNSARGRAELLVRVEKAARRLCRNVRPNLRSACIADTLRITSDGASDRMLASALAEREAVSLAAR